MEVSTASLWRAAGVDLPVIFPMPVGSDWGYQQTIAAFS